MAAVFKHMKPDEIRIWKKYMIQEGLDAEDFMYDVRVGAGGPIPEGSTDAQKRMIEALTQHRIDALELSDDQTAIYEVKKDFGLSAIGQALGYHELLTKDLENGRYTFDFNVVTFIIFETAEFDVEWVAEILGIVTIKVV